MLISQSVKHIRILFKTYLLGTAVFLLFRLILFYQNLDRLNAAGEETTSNILFAFIMGLRFDLVIAGYIMILPALILSVTYALPQRTAWIYGFIFYYILLLFSIAFFICAADVPYFRQFASRLDVSAFQWTNSPLFVAKMVLEEPRYWLFIIPYLGIEIIFYYLLRKIYYPIPAYQRRSPGRLTAYVLVSVLALGLIFLGIRGRIEKKSPIRVGTAYFSNNAFLNQLGLNPTFTLIRSWLDAMDETNNEVKLLDDATALRQVQQYLGISAPDPQCPLARRVQPRDPRNLNVVLVIMESMSAAKMSRYGNPDHLTPFLDSIAQHGYVFDNIYSAGIHTFNGIYGTLFSYPALFRQHPMNGIDMLHYNGISSVLKQHGYATAYFTTHDGQFDNVEGFLHRNDFDQVITQANYPPEKVRSALGVPDDYMFEFSMPLLDQMAWGNKKFLAAFMTASDHGPYIVPEYFAPRQKELQKQVVEFADWSLQKLVSEASKHSWFDSTVFVFVADHGAVMGDIYELPLNYHHSPFIVFAPKILGQESFDCIGGQIDVFPTIMGVLGLSYTNTTPGIDLLHQQRPYIFVCADDKYGVLSRELLLVVRADGHASLYRYRQNDKTDYAPSLPDSVNTMKAYGAANMQAAQALIKARNTGCRLRHE
jgi:phosphoglycerol transferase MdoB-like AlkP superfamily enzyme